VVLSLVFWSGDKESKGKKNEASDSASVFLKMMMMMMMTSALASRPT
jgi:hypothetical protein